MLAASAALCGTNFSRGGKGSRPRGLPLRGPPGGNGVALPKHLEPVCVFLLLADGTCEWAGVGSPPGCCVRSPSGWRAAIRAPVWVCAGDRGNLLDITYKRKR